MANAVLNKATGQPLEYRQLIKHPQCRNSWLHSSANEFGCPAQGTGNRIQGTNTIFFIHKQEIPADRFRDRVYAKFFCNEWTHKKDVNRTNLTASDNRINYPREVAILTAEMVLVKVI